MGAGGVTRESHPRRARHRAAALACLAGALVTAPMAGADIVVPSGAVMGLDAGSIDAACTDLVVTGKLNLDSGAIFDLRDVIVEPGGVLDGDAGSITLSRHLAVQQGGQFNVPGSSVRFDTSCGPGVPNAATMSIPALGRGTVVALGAVLALLGMSLLRGLRRNQSGVGGRRAEQ